MHAASRRDLQAARPSQGSHDAPSAPTHSERSSRRCSPAPPGTSADSPCGSPATDERPAAAGEVDAASEERRQQLERQLQLERRREQNREAQRRFRQRARAEAALMSSGVDMRCAAAAPRRPPHLLCGISVGGVLDRNTCIRLDRFVITRSFV